MKSLACFFLGAALVATVLALLVTGSTKAKSGLQACSVETDGSGDYTIIQDAVDNGACDPIDVGAGTFTETVTISRSLTIQGQGRAQTTVDGNAIGSVFTIQSGVVVSLTGMSIQNGAAAFGGGIFNDGTLYLADSILTNNSVTDGGGAIYNASYGTLEVTHSTVSGNLVDGTWVDGGGIWNGGTMTVTHTGLGGNVASGSHGARGGGIYNGGTLYVNHTTLSGNSATIHGGGIGNWGTVQVTHSTLSGNSAFEGGGISNSSALTITNSIIANSPSGGDCFGTITSQGYNIDSDGTCNLTGPSDQPHIDPLLGPLQDNGGPTWTHALLSNSLALDAGRCPGATVDQRGFPRPSDIVAIPNAADGCDIGAYELQRKGDFHQVFLPACFNDYCPDYSDDFSNPSSGWPIGENDHVRYGYLAGEYQVRTETAGYVYLFNSPSCYRENYVVEVDARWSGPLGSSYGIVFAIVGYFEQYYLLEINTEFQMYRLLYRSPAGWQSLVDPTGSSAISGGNSTNHLEIVRDGSEIRLEVNDNVLGVLHDSQIAGLTGAGIVSSPYNIRPDSDARFDNFSMVQLPGNGGAVLGPRGSVESDGLQSHWKDFVPVPWDLDWGS